MINSLDFLAPSDQKVVKQLLGTVVDRDDVHVNRLRMRNQSGYFTLFLGQRGSVSVITNPTKVSGNIATPLVGNGWMRADDSGQSGWYSFTDEAIEWFKTNRYTDSEIRALVGGELYRIYKNTDPNDRMMSVSAVGMAGSLHLSTDRVFAEIGLLCDLGLIREVSPVPITPLHGLYYFTTEGIRWAVKGFPEDFGLSHTVNVTVQVIVAPYIQQVEQLDISQDQKDQFEQFLRRFRDESEKEEPSYRPIQDALEMMANSRELAAVGIPFLVKHFDFVQRMIGHIPGL